MKDCKEYYEAQAAHHELGNSVDGRVRKAGKLLVKHLGTAERILDIGCGVGVISIYLKGLLKAKEVHGVEISEQRAAAARERGVLVQTVDIEQQGLPYESNTFDAVFCGELVEHVADTDHVLVEIGRVLTPEGVCVLTTPNLAGWYNRIALLLGWQPFETSVSPHHEVGRPGFLVSDWGCRDHLRVFTYRAIRELVRQHDFELLSAAGVDIADVMPEIGRTREKPVRAALYWAVRPLDFVLSKKCSLGRSSLIAFRKRLG